MPDRCFLVVDDDETIRMVFRTNFELDGHCVTEAEDVVRALDVFERKPVSVAVLDVGLGPDSGLLLARKVRERWPQTGIILVTGTIPLTDEVLQDDGLAPVRVDQARNLLHRTRSG